MKLSKRSLSAAISMLVALLVVVFNKQLIAAFSEQNITAYVEIDGMNFGAFDGIVGVDAANSAIDGGGFENGKDLAGEMKAEIGNALVNELKSKLEDQENAKQILGSAFLQRQSEQLSSVSLARNLVVILSRQFISEPSLYSWVNENSKTYSHPKDVQLLFKSTDGKVVAHYALKMAYPISWSLKSQESIAGGYHEVIHFSVQQISRQD